MTEMIYMKKTVAAVLSLILVCFSCVTAFAANRVPATEEWLENWSDRTSSSGKIWILPGEDENDRVFTWFSGNTGNTFAYSDGVSKFTAKVESTVYLQAVVNTVSLVDLADGTYKYTYTADDVEYKSTFEVNANDGTFTAAFCSDPQLGRSGSDSDEAVANDTYGWERTLLSAQANGAELILCAGDQVNDGFSQKQYNAFFSPDTMSSLTFAPTAGNHDFYSILFPQYFGSAGNNSIGNDYYFSYGNALFIVLDSNNIITPVHKYTIKKAISDYPDAHWRVVMLHHGAYSCDADEFTNKLCAGTLKNIFDSFDIDLVLSGHNHFYSRTYPIYNGSISSSGTVYFEAGSASGGKCSSYDTSEDGLIIQSFNLKEASYSLLTFTDDVIEVNSYLTDSGEIFDSFEVVKTNTAESYVSLFAKIAEFFGNIFSFLPGLFS